MSRGDEDFFKGFWAMVCAGLDTTTSTIAKPLPRPGRAAVARSPENFPASKPKPGDRLSPPLVNYCCHGNFFNFSVQGEQQQAPPMMGPGPKILNEKFGRPHGLQFCQW